MTNIYVSTDDGVMKMNAVIARDVLHPSIAREIAELLQGKYPHHKYGYGTDDQHIAWLREAN